MTIKPHAVDGALRAYIDARQALEAAAMGAPAIFIDQVTDDEGETFPAFRCPRCGNLIDTEDFYAVTPAESWIKPCDLEADAEEPEEKQITFSNDDIPELDETLYYLHDDHIVALPEGFSEWWI